MSENTEHGTHSRGFYVAIGATLIALTFVTMFAALVNLGPFNPVVALLIATIKATLVVLFFMHAKYVPQRTKLVIFAGIFWLALLLFMTLSDYASRVDYRGIRYPISQSISDVPELRG